MKITEETMKKYGQLLTLKQFLARQTAWSEAALRNHIFYADTNGLKESGAIVRIGRKILISEPLFIGWVLSQTKEHNS